MAEKLVTDSGLFHTDMNLIMKTCDFPTVGYTPARDSIAVNVNVKASRPSGNGTGPAGGAGPRVEAAAGHAVVAAVVALAMGAAVFP